MLMKLVQHYYELKKILYLINVLIQIILVKIRQIKRNKMNPKVESKKFISNFNKTNIFKIITIFTLILCMGLLFGCTTVPNSAVRITGKKGLEIQFLKSTPDEVYENTNFFTRLNIKNVGAYSINDESNPAFAALTTDKFYLQYDIWGNTDRSFNLDGMSSIYPSGDYTILDLPEFYVPTLRGNILNPETELFVSVCYPYQTTFVEDVCIDFDVYDMDERPKICHAEESMYTRGQGAPVAVTKVVPIVRQIRNKIIPEYFITIANVGNGLIAMPKKQGDTCDEIAKGQRDLGIVNIRAAISNTTLNCTSTKLNLINDEVEVRCAAINGVIGTTNYYAPLTVVLDYYYIESISKDFDITRTMIYDPSVFIRDSSCEGKEVGALCFKDSRVCNAESRCVDKCEFCASHETKDRYDFCNNVSADYSCSCNSDECTLLGEGCEFGLCKNKQCCNYVPNKKGITYSSRKMYLIDDFKDSHFLKDEFESTTTLTSDYEYRFKSVYPNSKKYCEICLYSFEASTPELMDCTIRTECTSLNNFLYHSFPGEDINKEFIVSLGVFDYPERMINEVPITDNHRIKIVPTTECIYDGQLLENELVCNLVRMPDESSFFDEITKCEYCASGKVSTVFTCDPKIDPNYGCYCNEFNEAQGYSYIDDDNNVDETAYCEGGDKHYCCVPKDSTSFTNLNGISLKFTYSPQSYFEEYPEETEVQACDLSQCIAVDVIQFTFNKFSDLNRLDLNNDGQITMADAGCPTSTSAPENCTQQEAIVVLEETQQALQQTGPTCPVGSTGELILDFSVPGTEIPEGPICGKLVIQNFMGTTLSLDNREIIEFELVNSPNLKSLYLRSNSLGSGFVLPSDLTSLEYLDLESNNLGSGFVLPVGLSSLRYLNLGYDGLGPGFVLPSDLTSLKELYLYYNDLGPNFVLPEGMGPGLTKLGLSNNDLGPNFVLPEDLGPGLKQLNLRNNNFGPNFVLPAGVGPGLEYLGLGNSELSPDFVLPDGLSALWNLGLGNSGLGPNFVLPEGLSSLTTLNLRNNGLGPGFVLPVGLSSLKELNLENSGLGPGFVFPSGLSSLRYLHLENNYLSDVDIQRINNSLPAECSFYYGRQKERVGGPD